MSWRWRRSDRRWSDANRGPVSFITLIARPYGQRRLPPRAASARNHRQHEPQGNCWDNSVAENFFSSIKTELVGDERYDSHMEAADSIGEYIDGFYNPVRRHSYLSYASSIEFELMKHITAFAA